jgi:hypothetical protein
VHITVSGRYEIDHSDSHGRLRTETAADTLDEHHERKWGRALQDRDAVLSLGDS